MALPVWAQHTSELLAVGAAAGMLPEVTSAPSWETIPWEHVLTSGLKGALVSTLVAVMALKVKNGTASLNPNVVAKRAQPT
jgi:hypothetical protein